MAATADELLRKALELQEPERARLVTHLLASLDPDSTTESLSDDEWIVEIERRARAALAGGPAVSWEVARRHIEDRF
jgi:putative addiction module component (TIGR02574 family)